MAQAPPIHHVTQTVTTLNKLLMRLVYCFGGWVGGWLVVQPPPPLVGVGQFWVGGSRNSPPAPPPPPG